MDGVWRETEEGQDCDEGCLKGKEGKDGIGKGNKDGNAKGKGFGKGQGFGKAKGFGKGKGSSRGAWQNKDKDAEDKGKDKDGKGTDGKGKGAGKDGNVKDGEGEDYEDLRQRVASKARHSKLWTNSLKDSEGKASEGHASPKAKPRNQQRRPAKGQRDASEGTASKGQNERKDPESKGKSGPPARQGAHGLTSSLSGYAEDRPSLKAHELSPPRQHKKVKKARCKKEDEEERFTNPFPVLPPLLKERIDARDRAIRRPPEGRQPAVQGGLIQALLQE